MTASWLHVSDFHFKRGDSYDRDVVLNALVRSVEGFRRDGRQPDLIFATGDVAHSGQESEYQAAAKFFDALCAAAGIDKRRLYVVPGNHDIDRALGVGLARTLGAREDADAYSGPSIPKPHITQKQRAFQQWYDQYFDGIRTFPNTSTCGPVEVVEIGSLRVGILPVNSALFCQGDDDHANLWIGRRCLDNAIEELEKLGPALKIALIHHPLDWLHDGERSNIRSVLRSNFDIILRGHLHETDVEAVAGIVGNALHMAAGATYQTRKWPNRTLYASIQDGNVEVFPIRYEDQPSEVWTVDPSVFPKPPYTKAFAIPRGAARSQSQSGIHIGEHVGVASPIAFSPPAKNEIGLDIHFDETDQRCRTETKFNGVLDAVFFRLVIANNTGILQRACRGFGREVQRGDGSSTLRDNVQLTWATFSHPLPTTLDLTIGEEHNLDVFFIAADGTIGFATPNFVRPGSWPTDFFRLHESYTFTVTVASNDSAVRIVRLILNWRGDWKNAHVLGEIG